MTKKKIYSLKRVTTVFRNKFLDFMKRSRMTTEDIALASGITPETTRSLFYAAIINIDEFTKLSKYMKSRGWGSENNPKKKPVHVIDSVDAKKKIEKNPVNMDGRELVRDFFESNPSLAPIIW